MPLRRRTEPAKPATKPKPEPKVPTRPPAPKVEVVQAQPPTQGELLHQAVRAFALEGPGTFEQMDAMVIAAKGCSKGQLRFVELMLPHAAAGSTTGDRLAKAREVLQALREA